MRWLVAGVLFLGLARATAQSAGVCSTIEPNVDYPGNDIKDVAQAFPEDCCASCAQVPTCRAFVWSAGTCHLKTVAAGRTPVDPSVRAVAGHVPPPAPSTCSSLEKNVDYPGNDIKSVAQSNASACCDLCADLSACRAFVWSAGECHLKSVAAGRTPVDPAVGAVAGLIAPKSTCSTVEKDVDYPGNDLTHVPQADALRCCGECGLVPNCTAFVWSDGVCHLKSAADFRTPVDPSVGAVAGLLAPPPPPTACSNLEPDVDYPGYDLTDVASPTAEGCCNICAAYADCQVFVWNAKTCYLKVSKRGGPVKAKGAIAGIMPTSTNPVTPPGASALRAATYQGHPSFPALDYTYIAGANWFNQDPLKLARESFAPVERAESDNAPDVIHQAEGGFTYIVLVNVTSTGECASLVAGFGYTFFTFSPVSFYCLAHNFTTGKPVLTSLLVVNSSPLVGAFDLSTAQLGAVIPAIPSPAACETACVDKLVCAAYTYASKSCTLFGPVLVANHDVAGWVHQPLQFQHDATTPYTYVQDASLPGVPSLSAPNISTLDACAAAAAAKSSGIVLFAFTSASKTCLLLLPPTQTPQKTLQLASAVPTVPTSIAATHFPGSVPVVGASPAPSLQECHARCRPSRTRCVATVYDSSTKQCTQYAPALTVGSHVGWLITSSLPSRPSSFQRMTAVVAAHQDDHALFFSPDIYDGLSDRTSKVVLVFVSAGDAGVLNGWYEAREAGVIATTQTWVHAFGLFSYAAPARDVVTVQGHKVARVGVGNAVHYFLRLPEAQLVSLLDANKPAAPIDQPFAPFDSIDDLKRTLAALLKFEGKAPAGVAMTIVTHESQNPSDHSLHLGVGRLTQASVDADAQLKQCATLRFFYGYQYWLSAVNMVDPYLTFQRHVWARLSQAIHRAFYLRYVWSDHSAALGRTYLSRTQKGSGTCNLT